MAFTEDHIIQIAALQHYSYCPRQFALIHIEQTFDENIFTLRGQAVHKTVDEPVGVWDAGVRVERALPLYSDQLGLVGKADVVEFHPDGSIFPIEYKHGRRRPQMHDNIQLAAQALCLEEMTGKHITQGAIYHHSSRRRRDIAIDDTLREHTQTLINATRQLLISRQMPVPANDQRCDNCSLKDSCQPNILGQPHHLTQLQRQLYRID